MCVYGARHTCIVMYVLYGHGVPRDVLARMTRSLHGFLVDSFALWDTMLKQLGLILVMS